MTTWQTVPCDSDASFDPVRSRRRGPLLFRVSILVLAAALLGVPSIADVKQQDSAPQDNASSDEKKGPRWEGRLRQQTETEEEGQENWEPPTGAEPVYTRDWVSRYAAKWMEHLGHLEGQPEVSGLEIGSFEGRSAIWFAENILTGPGATLTCVDLFGDRLDAFFDHNIKVTGQQPKIVKVTGKSQEQLYTMGGEERFDFVYIDGCHLSTCALVDIVLSWGLLKTDGILIIDDYRWEGPALDRPKLATDAFLEVFARHYKTLHKGYQIIIRKESPGY